MIDHLSSSPFLKTLFIANKILLGSRYRLSKLMEISFTFDFIILFTAMQQWRLIFFIL